MQTETAADVFCTPAAVFIYLSRRICVSIELCDFSENCDHIISGDVVVMIHFLHYSNIFAQQLSL